MSAKERSRSTALAVSRVPTVSGEVDGEWLMVATFDGDVRELRAWPRVGPVVRAD